jgi:hypothetical protein
MLHFIHAADWSAEQATVAGTVFLAEAFLNRDTRDALTASEQSYLHDSFKYTGGGLVLTAVAARSLFKSGVAYRIMAANPCMIQETLSNSLLTLILYSLQGWSLVSVWSAALDL